MDADVEPLDTRDILGKRKTIKLPTCDSSENLANEMADYFDNKVKIIIV